MRTRRLVLSLSVLGVVALAIVGLGGVGVAWAQGPQWQVQVNGNPPPGKPASVVLRSANDVYEVSITLRDESGKTHRAQYKHLAAGKSQTFSWPVPTGASRWVGELVGSAEGATSTAPLDIKVVSAGPLEVRSDVRDTNLAEGRLVVRPNRALVKAEVRAFNDAGEGLIDATLDVRMEGDLAVVALGPPRSGRYVRVELKLHDALGFWTALRVVSWYAEIPHEEVEFESGKWAVRDSETPKIDRAIVALREEVSRFRQELGNEAAGVDANVYVAGYTDTVGSAADNKVLSLRRAEAIARYIRGKGIQLPIFYQGFGESVLAVQTEDNTDEPRNRRAIYALSNAPPVGRDFPGSDWKRLP